MTAVFEGEKSPHVTVALEDYVTAAATVAAVRPTLGYIFGAIEMARASAALA